MEALGKRADPGNFGCMAANPILVTASALLPVSEVLSEATKDRTVAAGAFACSPAYKMTCISDSAAPKLVMVEKRDFIGEARSVVDLLKLRSWSAYSW